jgi:hypothetical protein
VGSVTRPLTEDVDDVAWANTATGDNNISNRKIRKGAVLIPLSLMVLVKATCLGTVAWGDTASAVGQGGNDADIGLSIWTPSEMYLVTSTPAGEVFEQASFNLRSNGKCSLDYQKIESRRRLKLSAAERS